LNNNSDIEIDDTASGGPPKHAYDLTRDGHLSEASAAQRQSYRAARSLAPPYKNHPRHLIGRH